MLQSAGHSSSRGEALCMCLGVACAASRRKAVDRSCSNSQHHSVAHDDHGIVAAPVSAGASTWRRSCFGDPFGSRRPASQALASSMLQIARQPGRACTAPIVRRHALTCRAASGGNRGDGGGGGAQTAQKKRQAPPQQPRMTGPLQMTTLEQLTSVERQPAPLWSTFCGMSGGCWQGTASAFSPYTGEPEPVALDEEGRKVYNLHVVLVDDRINDDNVERRVQHALNPEALQLRGNATASQDGIDWETERITAEEAGLVVFDGGSYSRGPMQLGAISQETAAAANKADGSTSFHRALHQYDSSGDGGSDTDSEAESDEDGDALPAAGGQQRRQNGNSAAAHNGAGEQGDEAENEDEEGQLAPAPADEHGPAPRQTVLVEQCVAWGGEQRVRFSVMLACEALREGEELDVEVLRVGVSREAWQCLTDDTACSVGDAGAPPPGAPLLAPADLTGDYKVFDLSAVPVEDTDPFTGETQQQLLYFSQETAQRWGPPSAQPDDGAALWLPGGLLLQLRMVSPASRGREADASEGVDTSSPRGLLLSCGWGPADGRGLLSLVEREYDGNGLLMEVRMRTAVRGGWVGGRM